VFPSIGTPTPAPQPEPDEGIDQRMVGEVAAREIGRFLGGAQESYGYSL
jgi:hypothetical protein